MPTPQFVALHPDERAEAVDTIVSAFVNDPVERWLWPGAEEYERHFPSFVEAFAGPALEQQTAWALGDFTAVVLWLSPGAAPDGDSIGGVLSETVASAKLEDTFAVLQQMDEHHPTTPHWYLPWLAVAEPSQGAGLGSALLEHGLALVDASGLPAYLETPNPRTVPLYERHGFAVTAVAQSGACPPMTMMMRDAR
jgi:GNAT superfamily N-acetyltransferase